ncbi:MAG TPA: ATP-binding domain-containing protein, partial [Acidobacteriota bacterium]|nr:ATP-binding domain-containing protein [Acidobacteriota bacterium]
HPNFRSFFATGDIRQRITAWGVRSFAELNWISSDFDLRQIGYCYRQSRQLAQLANIVAGLDGTADPVAIQMPEYIDEISVPAILGENLQGEEVAKWLFERILEIERSLDKVPSIAIFVDGDERIDPLLSSLRPLLAENNLDIVGCKEGRIVGIENQIRIFDAQYIKGLEFEAVFFVGVDILAAHKPGEFANYLYVGITRAATYLGITCENCLPATLEPLRPHLITSKW